MMPAKKKIHPTRDAAYMRAINQTERTLTCTAKGCTKKITIKGARTLKLCAKCKEKHVAQLAEARKERRRKASAKKKRPTKRPQPKKQPEPQPEPTPEPTGQPEPTGTVRDMRDPDPGAVPAPPEAVPAAPAGTPAEPGHDPETPVARETETNRGNSDSIRRASAEEALEIITAPERRNPREGFRHGEIGNTGCGKTTLMRYIVNSSQDLTLIHDVTKPNPQFAAPVVTKKMGQQPRTLLEGVDPQATKVLFRSDPFTGSVCEVEDVAWLGLYVTRVAKIPVRIVIDELDMAVQPGGRGLTSQSALFSFTQGRALQLSVIWSTQTPQRVPIQCFDQSSTIAIHRLGKRALSYMDERLKFERELVDQVIPNLASADEGGISEFILHEQGRPWNRTIYSIDVRRTL